ncbi:MAG: hypothetical protein QM831_27460 [Kofleriaceae bacterium]
MKTILLSCAIALVGISGCKKGGGNCDAVAKGVDTMTANGSKRMENAPPEMKAKMEEASGKMKGVLVKRCTEDKWAADVIDCYAGAQKREDLRDCRKKLPEDQAGKLQKEEMEVMMGMGMGGMGHGMHGGGMGGMGDHPPMGSDAPAMNGSGAAPAPAPTGADPAAPAPTGSATAPAPAAK